MPEEFINDAGNDVTEAFAKYVRPLAGPLYPVARLNAPPVDKLLDAK